MKQLLCFSKFQLKHLKKNSCIPSWNSHQMHFFPSGVLTGVSWSYWRWKQCINSTLGVGGIQVHTNKLPVFSVSLTISISELVTFGIFTHHFTNKLNWEAFKRHGPDTEGKWRLHVHLLQSLVMQKRVFYANCSWKMASVE